MVRSPVAPPGMRHYGTKSRYSSETLQKVLDDIKHGEIGQREAALKYGIPRQTLFNKLQSKHTEEKVLVKNCLAVSDMGIPLSLFDL
ncbi:hypothetical protein PR048_020962 [Dryococelus australis]|uniref:HTH psq-type domain-containing protein n=1 Tax=Dryococelus australis TaxID=614101 RepID=A0ABQ9GWW5_9NEOP|nr:hypothetical protein PR048_020962 [Dryococelus australis]